MESAVAFGLATTQTHRKCCSSSSVLTSAGRLSAFTKTCQKLNRTRTRVGAAANLRPAEEGKMRFRRRASKCSYLLGKGSPQTAPTFAVVPHHLTSSVFPMPPAQLQPLWIKRCARRKSQRPLGGSQRPLGVRILSVLGICILLVAPLPSIPETGQTMPSRIP